MKRITITALSVLLIMAACNSSKTTVAAAAPAAPEAAAPAPAAPAGPAMVKPANGVFAPGAEELAAIQLKYAGVTMETLTQGHAIYTGVCTNCHRAKSIYSRPEASWQKIMDDMAPLAKITDAEKDAVYKYVMAVKATQPK